MKKIIKKIFALITVAVLITTVFSSCEKQDVLLHDESEDFYNTADNPYYDNPENPELNTSNGDIIYFDDILSSSSNSNTNNNNFSDFKNSNSGYYNGSSFVISNNSGGSNLNSSLKSSSGKGSASISSKPSNGNTGGNTGNTGNTGGNNSGSYNPTYYASNTKAIWISQWNLESVFNASKNASQFTSKISAIMQKIKNYGFNTVVVQLRPNGDSFYPSSYYPWSKFCSGTVGKAPGYDPTAIMVNEAHKRGLSFHGWFNPLRLAATSIMAATPNNYLTKQWYNDKNKKGTYVVLSGNYWYLNPAYAETRNLIINGAKEIVSKYKVDALHIDDYFYPTTAASFDSAAYKAYGAGKKLEDFRRNNINILVKGIYSAVKGINSKIKFGISPAGNINNNYYDLYADVSLWGRNSGYMDYVMPQIYFGYKHKTLDYKKCLNQWKALVTNGNISLIVGLGAYKIGLALDGGINEWKTDTTILKRQVQDAKSMLGSKYRGFCIFDYDTFFSTNDLNTKQRDNMKSVI